MARGEITIGAEVGEGAVQVVVEASGSMGILH